MKNPAAPIIGRSDKIIEASGLNNRSPRIAAIIRLRNSVGLVGIGETTKEQKRATNGQRQLRIRMVMNIIPVSP